MNPQRRPTIPLYPYPPPSPHRTWVGSGSDDTDPDFPPIRKHKSTPPDPSPSPCNHSRPAHRSPPAVQRHSEQCLSSSKKPRHSPLRRHPPNTGLGNRNRLNTMESSTSARHTKVSHKHWPHVVVLIIEIMPGHSQILVGRSSGGCR
jgi:hypothetical protein